MYTAFWLWAVAQALLLPNWLAGCAGLIGFGILFLAEYTSLTTRDSLDLLNRWGFGRCVQFQDPGKIQRLAVSFSGYSARNGTHVSSWAHVWRKLPREPLNRDAFSCLATSLWQASSSVNRRKWGFRAQHFWPTLSMEIANAEGSHRNDSIAWNGKFRNDKSRYRRRPPRAQPVYSQAPVGKMPIGKYRLLVSSLENTLSESIPLLLLPL